MLITTFLYHPTRFEVTRVPLLGGLRVTAVPSCHRQTQPKHLIKAGLGTDTVAVSQHVFSTLLVAARDIIRLYRVLKPAVYLSLQCSPSAFPAVFRTSHGYPPPTWLHQQLVYRYAQR
jgi:hypothetical protein